jgi:hypothetical protein
MMALQSSSEMNRHFAFRGLVVDNRLKAVVLVLTYNNRAWLWFEGDCLKPSRRWMYDGFIWRVITELQGQGYRYVNMGDGGRPGKDMTARKYKKSFGGMVKETGRYAYIHNRFYWKTGKLLFKWYKKIRRFIYYYYCRK